MKADLHVLNSPVGDLLHQLERAKVTDEKAEWTSRIAGGLRVACIVGAIIVGFNPGVLGYLVSIPLVIALVTGAAGFHKLATRAAEYDIDDARLHSLVRLLKVLRADVPAVTPVSVTVDFRDYKTGGEKVARASGAPVYRQPWLRLEAPLLDGSRLALSLTDHVRSKEKAKRKYTKTTELWAGRVDLQLRLARRHGPAEAVATRLASLTPPAPLARPQAVGRGRSLHLSLRLPPSKVVHGRGGPVPVGVPEGRAVGERGLDALAFCYRGIAAARQAA